MVFGGVQKTSLIDYPGNICDTVFLTGCNFRCPYCHNRELVLGVVAFDSSWPEILAGLGARAHLLDGVCFSGGEPTLHKELPDWCAQVKELGLSVKVDTNGSNPELLEHLISKGLVDYVAMDVKAPKEKYPKVVRMPLDLSKIQRSIDLLRANDVSYEFRTTVPRSLLGEAELLAMGRWLDGAACWVLQRYRPEHRLDESFHSEENDASSWLREMQNKLSSFVESVTVRGI